MKKQAGFPEEVDRKSLEDYGFSMVRDKSGTYWEKTVSASRPGMGKVLRTARYRYDRSKQRYLIDSVVDG